MGTHPQSCSPNASSHACTLAQLKSSYKIFLKLGSSSIKSMRIMLSRQQREIANGTAFKSERCMVLTRNAKPQCSRSHTSRPNESRSQRKSHVPPLNAQSLSKMTFALALRLSSGSFSGGTSVPSAADPSAFSGGSESSPARSCAHLPTTISQRQSTPISPLLR